YKTSPGHSMPNRFYRGVKYRRTRQLQVRDISIFRAMTDTPKPDDPLSAPLPTTPPEPDVEPDSAAAEDIESISPELNPAQFVRWFSEVAPYVHAFRGKTFVVAFGGELVQAGALNRLVEDLSLLSALGIR